MGFLQRRISWWISLWMRPFGVKQDERLPSMPSGGGSPGELWRDGFWRTF